MRNFKYNKPNQKDNWSYIVQVQWPLQNKIDSVSLALHRGHLLEQKEPGRRLAL